MVHGVCRTGTPQPWWQVHCPQGRPRAEQSPPAQAPLGHWEGLCWGFPPQRGWAGLDPTPTPSSSRQKHSHHHPFGNFISSVLLALPSKPLS